MLTAARAPVGTTSEDYTSFARKSLYCGHCPLASTFRPVKVLKQYRGWWHCDRFGPDAVPDHSINYYMFGLFLLLATILIYNTKENRLPVTVMTLRVLIIIYIPYFFLIFFFCLAIKVRWPFYLSTKSARHKNARVVIGAGGIHAWLDSFFTMSSALQLILRRFYNLSMYNMRVSSFLRRLLLIHFLPRLYTLYYALLNVCLIIFILFSYFFYTVLKRKRKKKKTIAIRMYRTLEFCVRHYNCSVFLIIFLFH